MDNPNRRLHNLYLFLGIIVACIVIWQFIVPKLQASTSTNPTSSGSSSGFTTNSGSSSSGSSSSRCHADSGTLLAGVNSITVGSSEFVDVEWYQGSDPEKETILDSGTWTFNGLDGKYWRYTNCSRQEVQDSVQTHIIDRKNQGYNNAGYATDAENSVTFHRQ